MLNKSALRMVTLQSLSVTSSMSTVFSGIYGSFLISLLSFQLLLGPNPAVAQPPELVTPVSPPTALTRTDDAPAPKITSAAAAIASVVLTWDAVPGANHYAIGRAPADTDQFRPVADSVTDTRFKDTSVHSGTAYRFRVTVFRSDGHYGVSTPVSITTRPPINPTGFRASADGANVTLRWDNMPEVGYYWFSAGPGVGPRATDRTVTGTSHTITNVPPGTHTYELLAYYGASGDAGADERNPTRASVTIEWPVVRGLADFHNHQFAHFGFGGQVHSHTVDPSTGCRPKLDFDSSTFRLSDLVREGLLKEAARQSSNGQCYPTASNPAGQQVDTDSLKRAWTYGLRLLVVLAVNSEFLCNVARLPTADGTYCTDQAAIEAQFQAAKDLESQLDREAGAGLGWYRIVRTPEEARTAIGAGKLAVVLGIEASNAFGCFFKFDRFVPGIPDPLGFRRNPEYAYRLSCEDELTHGDTKARALALLEHYWDLGARHFFPVHNLDGLVGGTALSIPILHSYTNPSRLTHGSLFDRVEDIDRVVTEVRPPIQRFRCNVTSQFDGGVCNAEGLSATGDALTRLMEDYGAVIDLDHMALRVKNEVMANAGIYPFVSSHSGINEINHGDMHSEGQVVPSQMEDMVRAGGAFAPMLRPATMASESDTFPLEATVARHTCGGTTESFVQSYRYVVNKLRNGRRYFTGAQAFVGVGFGSDFNGLGGWPAPRFVETTLTGETDLGATLRGAFVGGSVMHPPGYCYPYHGSVDSSMEPHVHYPFQSPLTGESFDRATLSWSNRTQPYDISVDGVAHMGMIPDFVEEIRALGLTDAELESLWLGAEAYIRTWEASRSNGLSGFHSSEHAAGNRDKCRALRARVLDRDPRGIDATRARWEKAITEMQAQRCHGFD